MEPADAPDDHESQQPDHGHRPQVIPPLNAEKRHRLRREKEHGADAEIRRIPQVPAVHPQHVLREDRNQARKEVRPQKRRSDQDADADARDVRARRVQPLAVRDAPRTSSAPMAVTMARAVRSYASRMPKLTCAVIRMHVMRIGGSSRLSSFSGRIGSSGFLHAMKAVGRRAFDRLRCDPRATESMTLSTSAVDPRP